MIQEYTTAYLFCGIGGAAIGMQRSRGEYKGAVGRFRTLVGIDCDPLVCEDFENLTGAPAVQMDLFSRRDYIAFHGKEPPEGWREVTPDDILYSTGYEYPDMVFLSPPCKGFSGLLPAKSAASEKYQALNRLTVRGLELALKAFELNLPGIILFENVPRIMTRGKELLKQIKKLLMSYGYILPPEGERIHDCGELGGLGQRRKRYLLMARHPEKVSGFVYKPPKKPLKTIGDIIGPMPMPGDIAAGPLHRLPRLQWKTWVRLALIPAGGDWRDLQNIAPEQYRLEYIPRGGGPYGVQPWDKPGNTVIGNSSIKGSNGVSFADPRIEHIPREGSYKIQDWNQPSTTVVGSAAVGKSNGASCVADIRLKDRDNRHPGVYRISNWNETAQCVTGTRFGSGAPAVPDPRIDLGAGTHHAIYRVTSLDMTAGTVTGAHGPNNGALCVADNRFDGDTPKFNHSYRVTEWKETSGTITGGTGPSSGGCCVADPRFNINMYPDSYGVQKWDSSSITIRAATRIMASASSVADPRLPDDIKFNCLARNTTMKVQEWDEPGNTVTASGDIHSGAAAVADPRIPGDKENGIWIIIAPDGTWHRPLTTLELAALQGLPLRMTDGSPLKLAGKSDSRWREAIGNMVPPPAAETTGDETLLAFMASKAGEWVLGSTAIWVQGNDEMALPAILN